MPAAAAHASNVKHAPPPPDPPCLFHSQVLSALGSSAASISLNEAGMGHLNTVWAVDALVRGIAEQVRHHAFLCVVYRKEECRERERERERELLWVWVYVYRNIWECGWKRLARSLSLALSFSSSVFFCCAVILCISVVLALIFLCLGG